MTHSIFSEYFSHIITVFVIVVFIKTVIFPFYREILGHIRNGINTIATIFDINKTVDGGSGYVNYNKYQPGEMINIKYLENETKSAILNPQSVDGN